MFKFKYFTVPFVLYCCLIKSFANAQDNDTIIIKAKVIAIENYAHIVPTAAKENPYLILLEVAKADLSLIFYDSNYCKSRFVAEYSAISIDNIVESNWYTIKMLIHKRTLDKDVLKGIKESIGEPTNCRDFNLQRRWDVQYWI